MSKTRSRILIVDDSRAIHEDFRKILCPDATVIEGAAELFGEVEQTDSRPVFELDYASQGQEALKLVQKACAEGRRYALAFIDVRMPPGWDGIETTAHLWEVDPRLQVVLCTAYSDYSWQDVTKKLNSPDKFVILKKPFDVVEVLQLANAFSAKWRLQSEVEERTQKLQEAQAELRHTQASLERRVAERTEDLRAKTALLEAQINASPDGILVVDGQGRKVFQNQRTIDLWKIPRHIAEDPDDNKQGQFVTEATRNPQEFLNKIVYLYSHPKEISVDEVHLKDGTVLDRYSAPVLGREGQYYGRIWIFRDMTLRKQAQEALAYERELLQNLLSHSPDSIYFKDNQSRFVRCSSSFERFFRVQNVAMLYGKTDFDFFSEEHAGPAFQDEQEIMRTGKPIIGKLEKETHSEGRLTWCITNKMPWRDKDGIIIGTFGTSKDVTEMKKVEEELRAQRESFHALTENAPDGILRIDRDLRFVYANRVVEQTLGIPASTFLDKTNTGLGLPALVRWNEAAQRVFETGGTVTFEFQAETASGARHFESRLVPEHSTSGGVLYVLAVTRDITEQTNTNKERRLMEVQLRQAQKLESIGQLAAGIAHEINTPTQYVGDNTRFLKDSFESLAKVIRAYERLLESCENKALAPEQIAELKELRTASDLGYLFEQIPAAIKETLEGIDRVTKIVRAMKEFSHPGGKEKTPADLNKAVETAATVARNEWKYIAEMQFDLDPSLPPVPCLIGEFNQVILNLIVNAAHAIGDVIKVHPGTMGRIKIQTRRAGDS